MVVLEDRPQAGESVVMTNEQWVKEVWRALYWVCQHRDEFTVDNIRGWLETHQVSTPPNPSLISNILNAAEKRGWCERTGEVRGSKRKAAHRRKVAVWRSAGPALPPWAPDFD